MTQRGGTVVRRLRPTDPVLTLAYLANCLLDELRLAQGSEVLNLGELVAEARASTGSDVAMPGVVRNRFNVSSSSFAAGDSPRRVDLLAALIHRICERAEQQLGSDRSRDTYRAIYAALFSDRPADERALDLRARLPYSLHAPVAVQP
jgi:hypothetical protein